MSAKVSATFSIRGIGVSQMSVIVTSLLVMAGNVAIINSLWQERLKLARRRRLQQLKKCSQSDSGASKREKTMLNEAHKRRRESAKRVVFISSIMLLEAAARNDIEEGEAVLVREVRQSCLGR